MHVGFSAIFLLHNVKITNPIQCVRLFSIFSKRLSVIDYNFKPSDYLVIASFLLLQYPLSMFSFYYTKDSLLHYDNKQISMGNRDERKKLSNEMMYETLVIVEKKIERTLFKSQSTIECELE